MFSSDDLDWLESSGIKCCYRLLGTAIDLPIQCMLLVCFFSSMVIVASQVILSGSNQNKEPVIVQVSL